MRPNARKFFSDEEHERIRRSVGEAEAGTAGEIATMIVDESDGYREAELVAAILLSGLLSVMIAVISRHVTIWTFIPSVFILYFPMLLLVGRFPKLKMPFVTRRRCSEAVRRSAVRSFFEKGLYRTREETGILIYISLLERKVWILGDRGIDSKIDPRFWRSFAARLAAGIREGRSCDALCCIIRECGEELSRHFPRSSDDRNELTDDLIT